MSPKKLEPKKRSIYRIIAEELERRISTGEFPPGSKLPSERALAKEWNVNRSTVVSAYEELRALGLVERTQGSGSRVSTDIWGLTRHRLPNWPKLVENGAFLPNAPLMRHIRKETLEHDLIDFASGELSPDLFPAESFQRILAEHPFHWQLGYDHPQGSPDLRELIAEHIRKERGIDATPSSILITSGSQQALYLAVQCLLKPGDAIAIEDPSYCFSLPLFRSAGLKIFHLPLDREGINPEDLVALHRKHRLKMVFLNPHFQNPTGITLSLERKQRVLELSSELGIPVIEDDPYSMTAFSGERIPTLKSMDRNGTVLYISSLTKIVASGLRIGWVIGPQTVIERMADAKQQVDFGHSIFPQWVAHEFLQSTDCKGHMDKLRAALQLKRDLFVEALCDQLGDQVELIIPEGGIHLWCRLRQELDVNRLLAEAIRRGVVFVPGNVLGTDKHAVRFTFGRADRAFIGEGIRRFAEAYEAIAGE
ncbi:PLP-dependent aminotransferase family protein [Brevibacillus ruminantium]|uniref:PLP-dependent aminotransferase family protein n=1 Tax=Brevibacillus ruminantium TaxID=2950604 RepID=A0ABY4WI11_9BACL|nr:PLP-dependent aminotransferase family protein [Brevibacillus ruminantium]USG64984.1 PLP-dependent aminotransferase family protein [Brevibacillus ruminantium]